MLDQLLSGVVGCSPVFGLLTSWLNVAFSSLGVRWRSVLSPNMRECISEPTWLVPRDGGLADLLGFLAAPRGISCAEAG